jgi:hypothetical protein
MSGNIDGPTNGKDEFVVDPAVAVAMAAPGTIFGISYLVIALVVVCIMLFVYYVYYQEENYTQRKVAINIDDNKWSKVAAGMTFGPQK